MLDTARECIYAPMKSNNHVRLLTDDVSEDVIVDTMLICYMMSWLICFNPFALWYSYLYSYALFRSKETEE